MTTPARQSDHLLQYELRFFGLFNRGRGYAFPCDTEGHVEIDSLGELARVNYFYARAMVGREFAVPVTQLVHDLARNSDRLAAGDGTPESRNARACLDFM